ncbi:unnamed protein product [Gongylonema pulchrum]|uniref:Uncharacterized protein n=1 Tax=Gongylonema pulchrum TaxID=637853 RepID=A0A183DJ02_9BILA|nr:unnamed protein product [Gongylonema pulchrum]
MLNLFWLLMVLEFVSLFRCFQKEKECRKLEDRIGLLETVLSQRENIIADYRGKIDHLNKRIVELETTLSTASKTEDDLKQKLAEKKENENLLMQKVRY